MAMVVASTAQDRGMAEIAHDVRMVVKHTFLELVVEDDIDVMPPAHRARGRSFSDPNIQFSHSKCEMDSSPKSAASTEANDTDDDIEQLSSSDDEESVTAIQAPPGVWASAGQPAMLAAQSYVPVCVAFVPIMQQPIWPQKSSRSARRRRARAVNRWYRHNMPAGEEDGEFDDDWQSPESNDAVESLEIDGDSWPMPISSCEDGDKKGN